MVVVPQDLLARLEQRMTTPSNTSPALANSLDVEMQHILNDKSVKDDSEKWKRYQQVLHRHLNISTANRQPINIPIVENKSLEDEGETKGLDIEDRRIIDTFPAYYRNDARPLIDTLKRKGAIKWDENGVVSVNGEQIPDSNIVDILHSIVRVKKVSKLPPGWVEVMEVLKEMNIPSTYIGNETATYYLNRRQTPAQGKPSTPKAAPKRLSFLPTPALTPITPSSTPSPNISWEPFKY